MSDRHDDHDLTSVDITAEFWGTTRGWASTGSVPVTAVDPSGPVVRPRGNRSGRAERTRTHRVVTPDMPRPDGTQAPLVREAGIGELASGVPAVMPVTRSMDPHDRYDPNDRYDPFDPFHPFDSHDAFDAVDASNQVDPLVQAERPIVHEIELESATTPQRRSWFESTADRLGLGGVDPLLLRLGVIILLGVLLVPFALSLRADASDGTVETDVETNLETIDPAPASGAAPAALTPTADPAVEQSDPQAAPAPATVAATTVVAATASAEAQASAALTDETIDAIDAPATADAPAQRIEPTCAAVYTVHDGDYWIRLADASGVALPELLGLNVATIDTPLFDGDEVCLPAGATMPAPPPAPTTTAPRPVTTVAPVTTARPATTTPATTPATTAAPAYSSPEQSVAIIREVWPDELEEKAIQIAWRESNWRAEVYNGSCCYGLFQINWSAHRSWLSGVGVTSSTQLLDARTNARIALEVYNRSGGWGPWGG